MDTYIVVMNDKLIDFEKAVNNLRSNGWYCQGGIAFDSGHYLQAMVKPVQEQESDNV